MALEPREKRLPGWVREQLSVLREDLGREQFKCDMLTTENNRLRDVVAGKAAERGDADTFLINEDTGDEIPMGKGVSIRFSNNFTVRYDDDEHDLCVETDTPMQLRLGHWDHEIFITR